MAKSSKKSIGVLATSYGNVEHLNETAASLIDPSKTHDAINYTPRVDIFLTDDTLIVEVEVPGLRGEDIEVSFYRNILYVKGVKYECFDEQKIKYVCMERAFGRFYRAVELPVPVNSGKMKAAYENGVLTIEAPKITDDKRGQPHKIRIDTL